MATVTSYATKEHSVTDTPGNYGNAKDQHHPIGYSSSTGWTYRSLLRFATGSGTVPVGARISKVELWLKTTGSTKHISKGSNVRLRVSRLSQAFANTGGSGETYQTGADPAGFSYGGGSDTIEFAAEGQHKHGTVYKYDVTDLITRITHSGAYKPNGQPCDGLTNYGIDLKAYSDTNTNNATEFWCTRGGYQPRIVYTYTLEDDPDPAVIVAPIDTLDAAPDLFSFTTEVGNTAAHYAIRIGTTLDGDEVYGGGWVAFTPGGQVDIALDDKGIDWSAFVGQTLYTYVRLLNGVDVDVYTRATFYINPAPVVSIFSPAFGNLSTAHNLDDVVEWNDTSPWAMPRLQVDYTHPTGLASESWEVSINDGVAVPYALVVSSGGRGVIDLTDAVDRDTVFNVKVRALSGGVWSDWTANVSTRMNWSQAIWNVPDVAGAGSLTAHHDALQGGSFVQVAYLYRGVEGIWKRQLSNVTADAVTGIDVLIRMSTGDTGDQPALPAWSIEYDTSGDAQPDHWEATGATLRLDGNFRRFGVNSLRVQPDGGLDARVLPASPVVVSPETKYTMSVFVHTQGITLDDPVRLAYELSDGTLVEVDGDDNGTDDSTGKGDEDWQRIFATFTTPSGVEAIKPLIATGTSDSFSIDSFQLEEGDIASQWSPGGLGPAVVLDVGGIAVDGEVGGIFRMKSSLGYITELRENGLITTRHREVGEDARQLGTFWRGEWASVGDYKRDDMVLDGAWTMVANKDTEERAAPQPTGSPFWSMPEDPAWVEVEDTNVQFVAGVRISFDRAVFVQGIRFHSDLAPVDQNLTYSIYVVREPTGIPAITLVMGDQVATEDNWIEVAGVGQTIVAEGEIVDIGMVIHNQADTSYWNGEWTYATPNNPNTPGAGVCSHANKLLTALRFNVLDDAGDDRSAELLALKNSDQIEMGSMQWQVVGTPTQTGNYVSVPISPQTQGADGLNEFLFTIYQPQPAKHVQLPGYFSSQPLAQGFGGQTYDSAVFSDDAYGIDIKAQEVIISPDWDLVAYSAAAGGGGGSGTAGPPGPEGPEGPEGPQGATGPQGDQGETGEQGPQGIQGDQGIQGIQGVQGDTGLTGSQGDKGDTGETGATGSTGPKGDTGDTGSQGDQGIQGVPGDDGADSTVPGPEGPKGDTGDTGSQGIQGETGEQGPAGAVEGWKTEAGTGYALEPSPEGEERDVGRTDNLINIFYGTYMDLRREGGMPEARFQRTDIAGNQSIGQFVFKDGDNNYVAAFRASIDNSTPSAGKMEILVKRVGDSGQTSVFIVDQNGDVRPSSQSVAGKLGVAWAKWTEVNAVAGAFESINADSHAHTVTAPKTTRYTAGDTWTPTGSPLYVTIDAVGAGGGGGGNVGSTTNQNAGSGGGGGGYCRQTLASPSVPSSLAVTIGAGGAGAAAGQNNGSAGGTTTVVGTGVNLSATGGGAGEGAGTSANQWHIGGAGGTSSDGDVNRSGSRGDTSTSINGYIASAGAGGESGYGAPGADHGETWHGGDAMNAGAGGSGGTNQGKSSVNRSGGAGANGEVVITEYYQ